MFQINALPHLRHINVLFYLTNFRDRSYAVYSVRYVTMTNSTSTTMAFGFTHRQTWWFLDNIEVIDLMTGEQVNLDGGFESDNLYLHYLTCNLPESDNTVRGEITQGCGTGGWYCYLDGTMYEPNYLLQSFNTQGGHEYFIRFGLQSYGGTPNMAMLLVGH